MTTLAEATTEAVQQLAPSETESGNAARRDAELLLLHITGLTRAEVLTHPSRELTPERLAQYREAIERRARHEPVQYITGVQEFYGRPFRVTPAVLIPRPETEHLVEAVLAVRPRPTHILDIGTGSGILAITLALELPDVRVMATDISGDAIGAAQWNARLLGARDHIRWRQSDLFASLRRGDRFACIVSNPPYVATTEILESQVRDYEPASALYAGEDGLAVYRRLIPEAFEHLEPGGHLLLEIGHGQRDALHDLLTQCQFEEIHFVEDLQRIPRVAIAARE